MRKTAKFWTGVACKDHAEKSVKLGISQFCHGKFTTAKRLSLGFNSLREEMLAHAHKA